MTNDIEAAFRKFKHAQACYGADCERNGGSASEGATRDRDEAEDALLKALAHAARWEGEASANYVRQVPFKGCACAGCLAADPLHHPYLCAACYAKVAPESRWSSVNQPPETSEVEKARRAFYEAARAYAEADARTVSHYAAWRGGDESAYKRKAVELLYAADRARDALFVAYRALPAERDGKGE